LNTSIFVINQRKKLVILKLDFEKDFDKVEHAVIIEEPHSSLESCPGLQSEERHTMVPLPLAQTTWSPTSSN
jgi:hypothetical protein